MKFSFFIFVLIFVLFLSSCTAIPLCGERQYSVILPSGIPFVDGAFTLKTSNDHVDCERDPDERALPNG